VTGGDVIPWAALLLSAAGLFLTIERDVRSRRRDNTSDTKELEARLKDVEVKLQLVWSGVTVRIASELHKPHPSYARRDELIEKYIAWKAGGEALTFEELDEFLPLLAETRDAGGGEAEPVERFYAGWLYDVLKVEYGL